MLLTAYTSHFDRSLLKAVARENMYDILVTADTSHFDRSWLKADAPENMDHVLVTADTSQSPIDPCGPSEQSPVDEDFKQSLTASRSCCSDSGLNAAENGVSIA